MKYVELNKLVQPLIRKLSKALFSKYGFCLIVSVLTLLSIYSIYSLKVISESKIVVEAKSLPIGVSTLNLDALEDMVLSKEEELDVVEKKKSDEKKVSKEVQKKPIPKFNNPFIDSIATDVVEVSHKYGIYPSVMMAQAIIESAWGESGLTKQANNFFGVKAISGQKSIWMPTQEDDGLGNLYWIDAPFAVYDNAYASLEGNALVLYNNYDLYYGAFRKNTNSFYDATLWLTGRYATDTQYYNTLNNTIEHNNLHLLDEINPV